MTTRRRSASGSSEKASMASPSGVLSTRPPSQYDAPPISTHGNCGARLPLARMCRGSIAQTWSASRFGGGLSLRSRGWGWFRKRVSTPETTSTAVTTKVVGLALRALKSSIGAAVRADDAGGVDGADRDAGDALESDLAPGSLGL